MEEHFTLIDDEEEEEDEDGDDEEAEEEEEQRGSDRGQGAADGRKEKNPRMFSAKGSENAEAFRNQESLQVRARVSRSRCAGVSV
jgi:hypothetical protein